MNRTANLQKIGLASRRHHKKLYAAKLMRIAKNHAIQAHALETNRLLAIHKTSVREAPNPLDGNPLSLGTGPSSAPIAEAEVTQVKGKSEAELKTERLATHRKAVSMITGIWKDREGGPVDGVEYQNQMREAW